MPPFIPYLDQAVFQNTSAISWNKAVQRRIRIRNADFGSQFIPMLPCPPTITGLLKSYHSRARCAVTASLSVSFADVYECGALMAISCRDGFSQLVVTGRCSGSGARLAGALAVVQDSAACRSFQHSQT